MTPEITMAVRDERFQLATKAFFAIFEDECVSARLLPPDGSPDNRFRVGLFGIRRWAEEIRALKKLVDVNRHKKAADGERVRALREVETHLRSKFPTDQELMAEGIMALKLAGIRSEDFPGDADFEIASRFPTGEIQFFRGKDGKLHLDVRALKDRLKHEQKRRQVTLHGMEPEILAELSPAKEPPDGAIHAALAADAADWLDESPTSARRAALEFLFAAAAPACEADKNEKRGQADFAKRAGTTQKAVEKAVAALRARLAATAKKLGEVPPEKIPKMSGG
ncbi:MAG: hypothetical protein K8T20_17180 [Planctomycetes bacterium]|nr:hypothetical protein [Planctomycetota bacterium]